MARERIAKKREEHEVEFARIVAFSDGVFSIAITLLVLGLKLARTLPTTNLPTPSGKSGNRSSPMRSASP